MTEPVSLDDLRPENALSRRNLFLGAGAAALAAGSVASMAGSAHAAGPLAAIPHPLALGPAIGGLSYLPIDALDLFPDGTYSGGNDPRYSDPATGVGIAFTGGHTSGQLAATIPLPVGSVIRQINVSFRGASVILTVFEKPLATPNSLVGHIALSLDNGAGVRTQTLNLDGSTAPLQPITIAPATTYTARFYVGAGDTINGLTIGYTPPLQGFVAASGAPRVLDTREPGQGGKLSPGEERTVAVGVAGARSALFNLAVVNTEGSGSNPGGFVAAFPANIAYPNNSSINWFGPNQILSNTVLAALDSTGAIKIRGGANRTDVVIDRIGYFF